MQTSAMSNETIPAAGSNDAAVQAQIAAIRASLGRHKDRHCQLWEACAQETGAGQSRAILGRYTDQILNGNKNVVRS